MTPHELAAADPRDAARTIDWLTAWEGVVPPDMLAAALINALVRVAGLESRVQAIELEALVRKIEAEDEANETP